MTSNEIVLFQTAGNDQFSVPGRERVAGVLRAKAKLVTVEVGNGIEASMDFAATVPRQQRSPSARCGAADPARTARGTLTNARQLFAAVNRDNVYIKMSD
jgi:hypothetical protein